MAGACSEYVRAKLHRRRITLGQIHAPQMRPERCQSRSCEPVAMCQPAEEPDRQQIHFARLPAPSMHKQRGQHRVQELDEHFPTCTHDQGSRARAGRGSPSVISACCRCCTAWPMSPRCCDSSPNMPSTCASATGPSASRRRLFEQLLGRIVAPAQHQAHCQVLPQCETGRTARPCPRRAGQCGTAVRPSPVHTVSAHARPLPAHRAAPGGCPRPHRNGRPGPTMRSGCCRCQILSGRPMRAALLFVGQSVEQDAANLVVDERRRGSHQDGPIPVGGGGLRPGSPALRIAFGPSTRRQSPDRIPGPARPRCPATPPCARATTRCAAPETNRLDPMIADWPSPPFRCAIPACRRPSLPTRPIRASTADAMSGLPPDSRRTTSTASSGSGPAIDSAKLPDVRGIERQQFHMGGGGQAAHPMIGRNFFRAKCEHQQHVAVVSGQLLLGSPPPFQQRDRQVIAPLAVVQDDQGRLIRCSQRADQVHQALGPGAFREMRREGSWSSSAIPIRPSVAGTRR